MLRKEAREQAFLLLFSKDFHGEQSMAQTIADARDADNYEEDAYTQFLLDGVSANKSQIDKEIEVKLSNRWKFDRLPKTTIAILRIAVFEILFSEDVPDSVAINEAVELAKRFGDQKDYVFINGVLGNIARAKS